MHRSTREKRARYLYIDDSELIGLPYSQIATILHQSCSGNPVTRRGDPNATRGAPIFSLIGAREKTENSTLK